MEHPVALIVCDEGDVRSFIGLHQQSVMPGASDGMPLRVSTRKLNPCRCIGCHHEVLFLRTLTTMVFLNFDRTVESVSCSMDNPVMYEM